MKPFITIAIPHEDILKGRLTQDVFAASLWDVFKNRGPDDYKNPEIFFRKTFLTKGIKNLLEIAKKRLKGLGGDPIIQLQTPFGGGKTHSLIALYHKAKEWKANVVVLDGTAFDPKENTLWGEIEKQLTGKIEKFKDLVPPGKEKLRNFFEKYQPLLILIDEILQYTTRAAGIKVGDSTLAAQVLAFIHEFTGAVNSLKKTLLVLTLPSSLIEHYDESAERLFQQLQKITGRVEKIYTPVQDEEVASIIRRRLFSNIDEKKAKENIEKFIEYAKKENLFPKGIEVSEYRKKFLKSFPFQPEVIDVLYQRWGSYPTFQRTRGVLRLLALVIFDLKNSKIPFIRLGDFNLENEELRKEFVKHIGSEYDSVIAKDITDIHSGAKKVDEELGRAYLPYKFGTKIATAIFLYSFSGADKKGTTLDEIKFSCAELETPSSIVVEAFSKLKENLFYLQSDGVIYFSNQPNLNLLLLTKIENVTEEELKTQEKRFLESILTKEFFEIYIWPKNTSDIPDTKSLKLVILNSQEREKCKEFLENHGEKPRVYRNSIIFVCPSESERLDFEKFLRKKIAWEMIEKDETLSLTPQQKEKVREEIEKNEKDSKRKIRNLYRVVYLPAKEGLEEINLGELAVGLSFYLDKEVMERLKSEGKIVEKLDPLVIREKYLKKEKYLNVKNFIESFYKVPGSLRIVSEDAIKEAIVEGVKKGIFGYGVLENGKPICHYFKEEFIPSLIEEKIIVNPELCKEKISEEELKEIVEKIEEAPDEESLEKIEEEIPWNILSEKEREEFKTKIERKREKLSKIKGEGIRFMKLLLTVPSGKLSDFARLVNYIKTKFDKIKIKIELEAKEGTLTQQEYKEKIEEAINQSQMEIEEKEMK